MKICNSKVMTKYLFLKSHGIELVTEMTFETVIMDTIQLFYYLLPINLIPSDSTGLIESLVGFLWPLSICPCLPQMMDTDNWTVVRRSDCHVL